MLDFSYLKIFFTCTQILFTSLWSHFSQIIIIMVSLKLSVTFVKSMQHFFPLIILSISFHQLFCWAPSALFLMTCSFYAWYVVFWIRVSEIFCSFSIICYFLHENLAAFVLYIYYLLLVKSDPFCLSEYKSSLGLCIFIFLYQHCCSLIWCVILSSTALSCRKIIYLWNILRVKMKLKFSVLFGVCLRKLGIFFFF